MPAARGKRVRASPGARCRTVTSLPSISESAGAMGRSTDRSSEADWAASRGGSMRTPVAGAARVSSSNSAIRIPRFGISAAAMLERWWWPGRGQVEACVPARCWREGSPTSACAAAVTGPDTDVLAVAAAVPAPPGVTAGAAAGSDTGDDALALAPSVAVAGGDALVTFADGPVAPDGGDWLAAPCAAESVGSGVEAAPGALVPPLAEVVVGATAGPVGRDPPAVPWGAFAPPWVSSIVFAVASGGLSAGVEAGAAVADSSARISVPTTLRVSPRARRRCLPAGFAESPMILLVNVPTPP